MRAICLLISLIFLTVLNFILLTLLHVTHISWRWQLRTLTFAHEMLINIIHITHVILLTLLQITHISWRWAWERQQLVHEMLIHIIHITDNGMLFNWHYFILLTLGDADNCECQQLAYKMLLHVICITDITHVILLTLLHITHVGWCWQLRMPTSFTQNASSN